MLWVVAFFTIFLMTMGTKIYRKNKKSTPNRFSILLEIFMDFIRNDIVNPNIGKSGNYLWTPLIATLFIFILFGNLFGLVPIFDSELFYGGSATITGNFSVTVALASITFFAIIIAGSLKHGFIGHWKNMIPGNVPMPVLFILIPIEIMGMFIKPLALTLRLGANMTAGHIGIVAIFSIPTFIFGYANTQSFIGIPLGLVSMLLNVGIFFLELIVSLVQAYVFSLLTTVFIGMAIHAEH